MTSWIEARKRCPECAKLGKDRSHDNLAVYSDGGEHCFSCGYHVVGDRIAVFKQAVSGNRTPSSDVIEEVALPFDVTPELPQRARDWLRKYGITEGEIKRNNLLWSESRQRLAFPIWIEGTLIGWQGRYFGNSSDNRKWFSQGKLHEVIYSLGEQGSSCVLTEDLISAIKVSRVECSIPIFGSHISSQQWSRLTRFFESVKIWLDPDKHGYAVKAAQQGKIFGINTTVIRTDGDPKEYETWEIRTILGLDK